MQKKESILEVANNIIVLKNRLKTVTELKEVAFIPYVNDYFYDLKELDEIQKAWHNLYRLDFSIFYCIDGLNDAFNNLRVASISRKEFRENPSIIEACEGVEKFISKLKEKISLEEKKLNTLYNEFAKNTGDLSFIFKDSKIKQIITNELLLS